MKHLLHSARPAPASLAVVAGLLVAASLGLRIDAAFAGARNSFTEDFSTTAGRDDAHTTAAWDVVAGSLHAVPVTPAILGTVGTTGSPVDVTVIGDRLYVAAQSGGVSIYDLSSPDAPVLLGNLASPAAWQVKVAGSVMYVADATLGLRIVDISDPTAPVALGSFPGGRAPTVDVVGHLAYVADAGTTLYVLDVGDPAAPVALGSVSVGGNVVTLQVEGTTVYLATGATGLVAVDARDPANPVVAGQYDTTGYTWGVAVDGDVAYIGDGSVVRAIDVQNPGILAELGQTYTATGTARRLAVYGDVLLAADGTGDVSVLDITDPANPGLTRYFDFAGACSGVAVESGYIYAAAGNAGVGIARISAYCPPVRRGALDSPDDDEYVRIAGDVAYVATQSAGGPAVQSWDVSDPQNPVALGSVGLSTIQPPRSLCVGGDHGYVTAGDSLYVIDVADPQAMQAQGKLHLLGGSLVTAVAGRTVYASDGSGIEVIDATDPLAPVITATVTMMPLWSLDLEGSRLYGRGYTDLYVYDLAADGVPTLVTTYSASSSYLRAMDVVGTRAYLVNDVDGLVILDVSDPAHVFPAGVWSDPGGTILGSVRASGNLAYVEVGDSYATHAIVVLDVSDPNAPVELRRRETAAQGTAAGLDCGEFRGDLLPYRLDDGVDTRIELLWAQQADFDPLQAVGRSLPLGAAPLPIRRVRLDSVEPASPAAWSISAGGAFQPLTQGAGWVALSTSGTATVWNTVLNWEGPGTGSVVDAVTVEWLVDPPLIEEIADIPNDEGRQVRVTWDRSSHDFAGDTHAVLQYAVYRKVDLQLEQRPDPKGVDGGAGAKMRRGDVPDWDFLTIVPATADDSYSVVVPTLADSTIVAGLYRTTFMVSALTDTPTVFFDSLPDSGYSVDNLAPDVPQQFAVAYGPSGGNDLSWQESSAADFRYFNIYRGTTADFTPGPNNLVQQTSGIAWTDPDGVLGDYYLITAVDFAGNESQPTGPGTVSAVATPGVPVSYTLAKPVPNPFNPETTIAFELPAGTTVHLSVFDIQGRLVRNLVNGERYPEGRHEVVWNGRDDAGRLVASGTYLCRLKAGDFSATERMLLVK